MMKFRIRRRPKEHHKWLIKAFRDKERIKSRDRWLNKRLGDIIDTEPKRFDNKDIQDMINLFRNKNVKNDVHPGLVSNLEALAKKNRDVFDQKHAEQIERLISDEKITLEDYVKRELRKLSQSLK